MQTLFQALPVILKNAGGDLQVEEQIAFAIWRKVAGEAVIRHSSPRTLEGSILHIAVLDRTWKAQLEKLAPEYIARMARLSGTTLVTRLEFVVDAAAVGAANPPPAKPFNFQHTAEIVDDLRDAAAGIRDEDLRRTFLQAAARSIERSQK